jgi:hypothetical protein
MLDSAADLTVINYQSGGFIVSPDIRQELRAEPCGIRR